MNFSLVFLQGSLQEFPLRFLFVFILMILQANIQIFPQVSQNHEWNFCREFFRNSKITSENSRRIPSGSHPRISSESPPTHFPEVLQLLLQEGPRVFLHDMLQYFIHQFLRGFCQKMFQESAKILQKSLLVFFQVIYPRSSSRIIWKIPYRILQGFLEEHQNVFMNLLQYFSRIYREFNLSTEYSKNSYDSSKNSLIQEFCRNSSKFSFSISPNIFWKFFQGFLKLTRIPSVDFSKYSKKPPKIHSGNISRLLTGIPA